MKKWVLIAAIVALAALGTAGVAGAAHDTEPFLCPIVGEGVLNADANNGDNGVSAIGPPAGTSLLPGKNRAGANANSNAQNSLGDGAPNAGNTPGESGFTPIWTGAPDG